MSVASGWSPVDDVSGREEKRCHKVRRQQEPHQAAIGVQAEQQKQDVGEGQHKADDGEQLEVPAVDLEDRIQQFRHGVGSRLNRAGPRGRRIPGHGVGE